MRRFLTWLVALTLVGAAAQAQTLTSTVEGTIVAARSWNVSAEMGGKISRIHFIEGQQVLQGDLLVEFDADFKKAAVALAQAELAKAAVALEQAKEELSRQEILREKNTISEAAYLDAVYQTRLVEADYQVLKVKHDIADGILTAQKLYAPFDGQISAPRYAENTNIIAVPGAEIATIIQLDPIHIRAPQPLERVLDRLLSGEASSEIASKISVKLKFPNGAVYPHIGRIITWSVGLEESSQQVVVIVEFPNPDQILRPGMKVTVTGYE
jgi:RND family efflux transporter MFP subunit